MPKLPSLQAKDVIRVLKRLGFIEDRQKGSHLVLRNEQTLARTVVPIHPGRSIKYGLLFVIIKDARITVEEFLKLL